MQDHERLQLGDTVLYSPSGSSVHKGVVPAIVCARPPDRPTSQADVRASLVLITPEGVYHQMNVPMASEPSKGCFCLRPTVQVSSPVGE